MTMCGLFIGFPSRAGSGLPPLLQMYVIGERVPLLTVYVLWKAKSVPEKRKGARAQLTCQSMHGTDFAYRWVKQSE
jgi:hypothetical protein